MPRAVSSRKPRGFWRSPETLEVLRLFLLGKLSDEDAARRLECAPDAVKYHARLLRRSPQAKADVVSLRLSVEVHDRLQRVSRIAGRSVGETAAMLLTEKLREEGFPFIEFRASPLGRHPFVKGTSLAVWEVVLVGRQFGMDPHRTAAYLKWSEPKVGSAFAYARAYPNEIAPLVEEAEGTGPEDLRRKVPWLREVQA